MESAQKLQCICERHSLNILFFSITAATALKLTLPINHGAVVVSLDEEESEAGENTAAMTSGEQDHSIFFKSRRSLAFSIIFDRKRKAVGQDPDHVTVRRRVQYRCELSTNVTAVVSTPKNDDELVEVGRHSTGQASCFSFSTDPSVKILEIALDTYCHIYDVPF